MMEAKDILLNPTEAQIGAFLMVLWMKELEIHTEDVKRWKER